MLILFLLYCSYLSLHDLFLFIEEIRRLDNFESELQWRND